MGTSILEQEVVPDTVDCGPARPKHGGEFRVGQVTVFRCQPVDERFQPRVIPHLRLPPFRQTNRFSLGDSAFDPINQLGAT